MRLRAGAQTVEAGLIIFDKDGTLVDLHEPWGRWVSEIAATLSDIVPPDRFVAQVGWDAQRRRVMPESPLAVASLSTLQAVLATKLYDIGMPWSTAMARVADGIESVRLSPAPPICPIAPLFKTLTEYGFRLGVVTTDDRAGAIRDLEPLDVLQYIQVIIGGDSQLPTKPAPDMLLKACAIADIDPQETIVVGDSVADMWMGRAAGVALLVGVLSGANSEAVLAPHADVVLATVAGLAPA